MEVSGSYRVEASRERVWDALMDPDVMRHCIPGIQKLTAVSPDRYEIEMAVKVGIFSGAFTGTLEISEKEEPISYRMAAHGAGPMTSVSGEAVVSLAPDGDATNLSVEGNAKVSGALARVGQRFMSSAAKSQFDYFFQRLRDKLA